MRTNITSGLIRNEWYRLSMPVADAVDIIDEFYRVATATPGPRTKVVAEQKILQALRRRIREHAVALAIEEIS